MSSVYFRDDMMDGSFQERGRVQTIDSDDDVWSSEEKTSEEESSDDEPSGRDAEYGRNVPFRLLPTQTKTISGRTVPAVSRITLSSTLKLVQGAVVHAIGSIASSGEVKLSSQSRVDSIRVISSSGSLTLSNSTVGEVRRATSSAVITVDNSSRIQSIRGMTSCAELRVRGRSRVDTVHDAASMASIIVDSDGQIGRVRSLSAGGRLSVLRGGRVEAIDVIDSGAELVVNSGALVGTIGLLDASATVTVYDGGVIRSRPAPVVTAPPNPQAAEASSMGGIIIESMGGVTIGEPNTGGISVGNTTVGGTSAYTYGVPRTYVNGSSGNNLAYTYTTPDGSTVSLSGNGVVIQNSTGNVSSAAGNLAYPYGNSGANITINRGSITISNGRLSSNTGGGEPRGASSSRASRPSESSRPQRAAIAYPPQSQASTSRAHPHHPQHSSSRSRPQASSSRPQAPASSSYPQAHSSSTRPHLQTTRSSPQQPTTSYPTQPQTRRAVSATQYPAPSPQSQTQPSISQRQASNPVQQPFRSANEQPVAREVRVVQALGTPGSTISLSQFRSQAPNAFMQPHVHSMFLPPAPQLRTPPSLPPPSYEEAMGGMFSPQRLLRNRDEEEDPGESSSAPVFVPPDSVHQLEVDPQWINIGTLRAWIDECTSQHGDECAPHAASIGMHPKWLIDVREQRLVPGSAEKRYLALSYVWGSAESTETTRDNMVAFMRPGAFSPANGDVHIPATIRHAMALVGRLGEDFLWVDRLCICQDDAASRDAEIDAMDSIYSNALVTLIAASGWDAEHGLRGIKGATEARQLAPNFGDDYLKHAQPGNSVWYSRGWTFQELLFPPRKLMFQSQVAVWECGCAVYHEAFGTQNLMHIPRVPKVTPWGRQSDENNNNDQNQKQKQKQKQQQQQHNPLPTRADDLAGYFTLVRDYNTRNLTYPRDALRAFSGVTSALSKPGGAFYPEGFLWGLPLRHFGAALLWLAAEPLAERTPLKLQAAAGPSDLSGEVFPTWSWVGWCGSIDSACWAAAVDGDAEADGGEGEGDGASPSWKTSPHKIEPECTFSYATEDSPFEYRPLHAPGTKPLQTEAQQQARTRKPTSRLKCNGAMTRRFLMGDRIHLDRGYASLRRISNGQGDFCGVLCPDQPVDPDMIAGEIECVALSGCAGGQVMYGDPAGSDPPGGVGIGAVVADYYNVLWVKQVHGVAYRRGVGRVLKSRWTGTSSGVRSDILLG